MQVSKCHFSELGIFDGAIQRMMDGRKIRSVENSMFQIWTSNILSVLMVWWWWVLEVIMCCIFENCNLLIGFLQCTWVMLWLPLQGHTGPTLRSADSRFIFFHISLCFYTTRSMHTNLSSPRSETQTTHPWVSASSKSNNHDIAHKSVLVTIQQIIVPQYRWVHYSLDSFLTIDILVKTTWGSWVHFSGKVLCITIVPILFLHLLLRHIFDHIFICIQSFLYLADGPMKAELSLSIFLSQNLNCQPQTLHLFIQYMSTEMSM